MVMALHHSLQRRSRATRPLRCYCSLWSFATSQGTRGDSSYPSRNSWYIIIIYIIYHLKCTEKSILFWIYVTFIKLVSFCILDTFPWKIVSAFSIQFYSIFSNSAFAICSLRNMLVTLWVGCVDSSVVERQLRAPWTWVQLPVQEPR